MDSENFSTLRISERFDNFYYLPYRFCHTLFQLSNKNLENESNSCLFLFAVVSYLRKFIRFVKKNNQFLFSLRKP